MNSRDKKSLIVYVVITYAVTWLFWIVGLLRGYQDITFLRYINWEFESTKQMSAHIIFRIGVYGPIIGAFITSYLFSKKRGMKKLAKKIFKVKVDIKWYLFLFLIPILINLIVVLIGLLMGIEIKAFFNSSLPLSYIIIFFIYQVFTSGLEEPGWRGYALEKIQNNYTAEKTGWILGLIWAVWHFPYVISLYAQAGFLTMIFSLAGFSMAIIGQTFIIIWFYNNTKSVFIAILLHAWLNTSATFILGDLTIINPIMGILPAVVTWAVVFILLKVYGGETLTESTA